MSKNPKAPVLCFEAFAQIESECNANTYYTASAVARQIPFITYGMHSVE